MATLRASSDILVSSDLGHLPAPWAARHPSYHPGREKLVRRQRTGREVLLVDVLPDGGERRPVRLEPVGPEILAEHPPGLLDMVDQERQRQVERIGIVEALHR